MRVPRERSGENVEKGLLKLVARSDERYCGIRSGFRQIETHGLLGDIHLRVDRLPR
jgi:hypothetical protein